MSMELGFFLPHVPPDMLRNMAIMADSAGFDFMCSDDHLMSPFSAMTPDFEGCYESWTSMAYLAGKTEKIKVSHMVLIPSFRNPAVLAKMAATLHMITKGRLDLTVGAGWYENEFNAFNIPWENHNERIKREEEAIRIIREMWTGDKVTFDGEFYKLNNASLDIKPMLNPLPRIWVGGDSKKSMELAAKLGDGWLMHGHSPEEVEKMVSKITPMLGDKKEHFGIGTAHFVLFGEDKDRAYKKMRKIIPERTWDDFMKAGIKMEIKHRISGSPEECIERFKKYADIGVTRLITIFLDPADVGVFVEKIMPSVKKF